MSFADLAMYLSSIDKVLIILSRIKGLFSKKKVVNGAVANQLFQKAEHLKQAGSLDQKTAKSGDLQQPLNVQYPFMKQAKVRHAGPTIIGCTVTGVKKAIVIDGCGGVTIESNVFQNCDEAVSVKNSNNISIKDNRY